MGLFQVGTDDAHQVIDLRFGFDAGAWRTALSGLQECFPEVAFQHLGHQAIGGAAQCGQLLQQRAAFRAFVDRAFPMLTPAPVCGASGVTTRFFSSGECGTAGSESIQGGSIRNLARRVQAAPRNRLRWTYICTCLYCVL